jgi:hypothetical protein
MLRKSKGSSLGDMDAMDEQKISVWNPDLPSGCSAEQGGAGVTDGNGGGDRLFGGTGIDSEQGGEGTDQLYVGWTATTAPLVAPKTRGSLATTATTSWLERLVVRKSSLAGPASTPAW